MSSLSSCLISSNLSSSHFKSLKSEENNMNIMNLTLPQNTQHRTTKEHDRPHHTSTFFVCMYKNTFSACTCLCRPNASRVHHVSLRLLYYIKAHTKPFGLFRWRHSQNRTDGSPQNRIQSQGAFDNERNVENSSLNDCITLSSTRSFFLLLCLLISP